jgi:putative Ca2+/H+ antiporter (TMEM165/GDT1 family)
MVAFFLAEIGDKTQIATAVLGGDYQPLWQVIAGTTCGMLIAVVPAVWLGARFAHALPLRATRLVAAALFVVLAIWILLK